ncbi:hypothetical protein [Phenylobacterium sp.]|uniref:hypothetical protein n=1 Tax=Phenylobacterium sp. TaxID=1871053 RepID=UPI002DF6347E|nr:hypothetical protein [Phenylobacterium sp.]
MRLLAFAAVSALALGASACGPRIDYAHRTSLDCPDRQGELRRTGAAADGKSCTYASNEGAEIALQLTPVNGDAGATLSALETSLVGPATPEASGAPKPPAPPEAPAKLAPPAPPAPPAGGGDAAQAAREASADAGGSGGSDWNAGDKHVRVVGVGGGDEHAHVNFPGLHIDTEGDSAKIDVAGVHIDANDENATVHVVRDVRLRGQGFSRERNGLRATFIAKRENMPDGYRFVGYQASGPKAGPLTIAVVKSRDEIFDGGRLYRDIQRLVRRNGGA